jgi:hypothetical protein
MGKNQETPQQAAGINGKRGFVGCRPMEKARKPNNLL